MIINASKLKRSKKYLELTPRPDEENRNIIKGSLMIEGQNRPLIVNKDFLIIDGYTRDELLEEIKVEKRIIEIKNFKNRLDEEKFIIEDSYARKHYNLFQRHRLILKLYEIERNIAKKRQKELGKTHGKSPLVPKDTKGRSSEIIGKRYNVSAITLERVYKIVNEGTKQQIQDAESGTRKIRPIYNEILNKQPLKKTPQLPKDQFNFIYPDIPWQYGSKNTGGNMSSGSRRKYPTMTVEQAKKLGEKLKKRKIFAKDCICAMWAVAPLGKDCQEVLESWGFKFHQKVYWIKIRKKAGFGAWFSSDVEEILIGTRGKVKAFHLNTIQNYIISPILEHSEKPEEIRELLMKGVRKSFAEPKCLEMFARRDLKQEEWTYWGYDLIKNMDQNIKQNTQ